MTKYLYGASITGIQDFIFATNKLQEIIGASEIIKNVSVEFDEYNADEIIINTAGNIKAIFNDKTKCEKVVLEFSKKIQQQAYGISISQGVVALGDDYSQLDIDKLEKILKEQRNKASIPLDMSINIMKLYPSTAKAISNTEDIATSQKKKAFQKLADKNNTELNKLSNQKNKIAVIHIDGNALGELIPKLNMLNIKLSEFSKKLDNATKTAFENAKKDKQVRNIILGGDDVTIICNGDDALNFTKEFLENFEKETKKVGISLTACAGIAYSNAKYPFHYAINLAEALCKQAKNHSKRESSCLMFHNIQSSTFVTWDKFVKDELTISNDKREIRCDFGAYYLDRDKGVCIQDFMNIVKSLRDKSSPSSSLRSWLSELYKSDIFAGRFLERVNKMAKNKGKIDEDFKKLHQGLSLDNLIIENKTPIYDILQIISITADKENNDNKI